MQNELKGFATIRLGERNGSFHGRTTVLGIIAINS